MQEGEILSTILGALVLVSVVLLLIRQINLWYWKVNEQVKLLHAIRSELCNIRSRVDELREIAQAASKQREETQ